MSSAIKSVSNFGYPYSGILQGRAITAKLKSEDSKNGPTETLTTSINGLKFKTESIDSIGGVDLCVYDKNGVSKSNIIFDNEGKVQFVGTETDNDCAYFWPQDRQVNYSVLNYEA